DHRSVKFFNGDPVWREHRALIGCSVGHHRRALLVQPHGHAPRCGILYYSLKRKEPATAHDRGLDLFAFIPPCHATMRIEDLCHYFGFRAGRAHFISNFSPGARWSPVNPNTLPVRVKPGKLRLIVGSETAERARRAAYVGTESGI